jgi:hypothetical protein
VLKAEQLANKYGTATGGASTVAANAMDGPAPRAYQGDTRVQLAGVASLGPSSCAPYATDTNARATSNSQGGLAPRQFPWN